MAMRSTGKNIKLSSLAKQAAKIKVNKKLNDLDFENSPFLKKKMDKANEILAKAPLPK